jgi:hypothetical protein
MNTVVIANLVSIVGCVLMVGVGLLQKRRQILLVQCVQFAFLGAANLLLGGMTGFISGVVSIVRNLVYVRWEDASSLKLVFILVQLVLSLSVGIHGLVDWFPIFSTVLFTWFLEVKSEVRLKLVMILAQSMWLIYDFVYLNYVSFTFDALTILSNAIGILVLLRKTK